MTIENVIKSFCSNCIYYDRHFGICKGEVLHVERAILKNAEGRGLCDKIKDFITKGGK